MELVVLKYVLFAEISRFSNGLNSSNVYGLPTSRRTGIYRLLFLLLKKCSMEGGNIARVYYKMKMLFSACNCENEAIVPSSENILFVNFTSFVMHLNEHQDN